MTDQPTDPVVQDDGNAADATSANQQGEANASETQSASSEAPPESAEAPAAEAAAAEASEPPAENAEAAAAKESKPPPNPALYRALRARRPVSGKVEKVIKGGFEIKIPRVRGFCPASQMSVDRIENPESLVGQTFDFRVIQIRAGGQDVVLSRRALVEAEREEEAKAVRATLVEGSVMRGRVAGLADFGAFVDLGAGVRGLVHLTELSHGRVDKASDAVSEGDSVDVKILKIDEKRGRISLSRRQAIEDPWKSVAERFEVDKAYPGTVKRITDFGLFIELEPGVEGLAPAGDFAPMRGGLAGRFEAGHQSEWVVGSMQPKRRRIALREPAEEGIEYPAIEVGAELKGRVQRVERFGVFVWLSPGRVGLVPNMFTGAPKGVDMAARFPVGDEIEVNVLDIEEDGRRIRLCKKGVKTDRQQNESRGSQREDDPATRPRRREKLSGPPVSDGAKGAFGQSLADKLKAALDG